MNRPLEREDELEILIGTLIKILGKSNEQVSDLNKRVKQLETIVRELAMQEYQTIQIKSETAAFPN